jgi:hypothetical protein
MGPVTLAGRRCDRLWAGLAGPLRASHALTGGVLCPLPVQGLWGPEIPGEVDPWTS